MISTEAAALRVAYGPYPGQFGDLYIPKGADPALPVAVVLHGGWWKDNQTLDSYPTRALVSWLAERGENGGEKVVHGSGGMSPLRAAQ